MKVVAKIIIVFFILFISNANQSFGINNNKKCELIAEKANQIYTQAIIEAERSKNFDEQRAISAHSEAYNLLLKNFKKCTSSPVFISELVYFDLGKNNLKLATEHVEAGLKKKPNEASMLMNKAEILLKTKQEKEAFEIMEQAYANSISNTFIIYNYCNYLVEYKKYNRAIKICSETIQSCEKSNEKNKKVLLPWAYSSRAHAYNALGNKSKALEDVKKAKKLGLTQPWLWPEDL